MMSIYEQPKQFRRVERSSKVEKIYWFRKEDVVRNKNKHMANTLTLLSFSVLPVYTLLCLLTFTLLYTFTLLFSEKSKVSEEEEMKTALSNVYLLNNKRALFYSHLLFSERK